MVITEDHRHVRITAQRRLLGTDPGNAPAFSAHYDELTKLGDDLRSPEVWATARYPWEHGNSAEECLRKAIRWVCQEPQEG